MSIQFGTFSTLSVLIVLMTAVHNENSWAAGNHYSTIEEVDDTGIYATSSDYSNGQLWLGTFNGLAVISPNFEKVFNVSTGHLSSDEVFDVLVDDKGIVWASLNAGVFVYDFYNDAHRLFDVSNGIPDGACSDLEEDKNNNKILLVCGKALLTIDEQFSINSIDFSRDFNDDYDDFSRVKIISDNYLLLLGYFEIMLFDRAKGQLVRKFDITNEVQYDVRLIDNDNFIVASSAGVHLYNINSSQILRHFKFSSELNIVNDGVHKFGDFSESKILILTVQHGVYLFDKASHEISELPIFYPYLLNKYIPQALTFNQLSEGFAIATIGDGVQLYPNSHSFLNFFEKNRNEIPEVFFSKKLNEKVLFGNGQSLYLLDIQSRNISTLIDGLGSLLDGIAFGDGYLVQSDQKGLIHLTADGDIYKENVNFSGLPDLVTTDINRFHYLGGGEYLLGLYGDDATKAGVFKGNFEDGFKVIAPGHNISDFVTDSNGSIFALAPQTGVFKIDERFQATHFPFPEDINYIDCIERLSENTLLLCTRTTGVILFDASTGQYKQAFKDSTSLSKMVRDIYVDKNSRIWLMTGNGLVTYGDLAAKGFRFNSNDGIASKEYALNSALEINDSEVMIFGNKDLFSLNIDEAERYINDKRLKITNVDVVDFSSTISSSSNRGTNPFNKNLEMNGEVEFPHDVLNLKLRFTHDNLIDRNLIRYEIKLEGLEDKWRVLDQGENSVTFSTLPPGQYRFQVRAYDPRSFESQPIKRVNITVNPPWWKTVYAYVLYMLFFALITYFIQWFRSRQLQLKNQELAEKVKERTNTIENMLNQKQTFFANVSHEFRTPLSLIMAPIDYLSEKLNQQDETQQLSIMKRNTNRLMRLVDQILELAKFETSKHLPKEVYDVGDVLNVLSSSFSSLLEAKQQTLTIQIEDDFKLKLIQDSLEMIAGNLLSNAIKYCPQGAHISIVVTEQNGLLSIVVSDNGKGISPQNLKLLFERFTRFDAGEDVTGSGIGLALVKQLVTSNDGTIDVQSVENEGTTFIVQFPVNVSQSESVTHVAKPQIVETNYQEIPDKLIKTSNDVSNNNNEAVTGNGLVSQFKVLVVEDNPDLRSYLFETLSSEYEIELAKNGEEGLKKAQQNIPDLILSDVLMPVMDGYELSNAIRSDDATSHIPIILLTAKGDDLSRMKGWEENVDDYVTKPFKLKELRSRISRLISIRDILKKKHTAELTNNLALKNKEAISFQTKRDKEFFVRFEKVISEHYDEENFSRTDAASYLALSERQLNRKLSALVDYNFSEYLRKYRLQQGRDLLLAGKQVTEVSYEVGFNSPSYFSSCFKAEFEQTPKQYVEERENKKP